MLINWLIKWLIHELIDCVLLFVFFSDDNEPKSFSASNQTAGGISASSLAARLKREQAQPSEHVRITRVPSRSDDDDDVDESEMSPEELEKRREFKEHRKKHYNEFQMAQKAKELLQQEEQEDLAAGDVPMTV